MIPDYIDRPIRETTKGDSAVLASLRRITHAQRDSGMSAEDYYTALARISEMPWMLRTALTSSAYTRAVPNPAEPVKLLDQMTEPNKTP